MFKLDLYEFTVLLDRAKKGNDLSVFSNRTDEASAAQYFQVINIIQHNIIIIITLLWYMLFVFCENLFYLLY